MTPEGKVKAKVRGILNKHGVYFFSPLGSMLGRGGIPDIICCHRGKFLAIECKAGRNTTTALQNKELADIRAHQGIALVVNEENVDGLEDVLKLIELYK